MSRVGIPLTVTDLRCDCCGRLTAGPAPAGSAESRTGVRFSYHPGDPRMRDDSGLLCAPCWASWAHDLGVAAPRRCACCGLEVSRLQSLHLRRLDEAGQAWQLCRLHAAERLNLLRTVEPKFDPQTFRLPLEERTDDLH